MNIDHVRTSIRTGDEIEETQYDEDSEQYFSLPLYFTQLTDGSIEDVAADENEDPELIDMKVAVLYALRTTITSTSSSEYEQVNVIDPQGSHYEYVRTTQEDGKIIVQSHYSGEDFIAFADEDLESDMLLLDGTHHREIINDRIVYSSSTMNIMMNRAEMANNDEDSIALITSGSQELSNFMMGNSEDDFEYDSVESFMNAKRRVKLVQKLKPSHYHRRTPKEKPVKIIDTELDGYTACPSGIDFCKGFDNSWNVGNNNAGLRFRVSATAGVKKGCTAASRSYMVGAYANIDVLILGRTVSAAEAYAEYGQVNGSPLRNGIELKVFGHSFYKKSFPNLDCISRSITLAKFSKDFSFSYTVVVYIVTIKFTVGITMGFSATLAWQVCPMDLKASITLTPSATATLHGGATASAGVARAGIEIRGTITDYLDPTAYVDGNLCRVGFSMYNNLTNTSVSLVGWWQIKTVKVKGIKISITWGSKHEHVFWKHNWPAVRSKILDVYYGAK
jgi:hypothetical protein